jgi:hypothetical protein
LIRRRIVVVVEDDLREHARKKLFSHKKKISLLDDNKVRYWLAYLKIAKFPFISDLPRLHRVQDKEHTQIRKPFLLYFLFSEITQSVGKIA